MIAPRIKIPLLNIRNIEARTFEVAATAFGSAPCVSCVMTGPNTWLSICTLTSLQTEAVGSQGVNGIDALMFFLLVN
jgi:hypothetical protein